MPRTSSNKLVHVDILDDDGCIIGIAHAYGCAGAVLENIKMRIRNLKGETHDC